MAGELWLGELSCVLTRYVMAGQARHGAFRLCLVVWGVARRVMAGKARLGWFRNVEVGSGEIRYGRQGALR